MPTSTEDLNIRIQADIPESNVRNHLRVLGVFFHLLESASRGQAETQDEFFQRATYRLQLWVETILKNGDNEDQPLQEHELPPLDVAMALHSLMLSPCRYFEDSELRFRQLKRLTEYPLDMIVAVLDASNSGYDERRHHPASDYWHDHTGLQFDAIESMRNDAARSVTCPACGEAVDVPWRGTHGFAGSDFRHQCYKCQMILTHDTLGAGKFLKTLTQAKKDPKLCLPNTATLIKGELEVHPRCAAIVAEVWKCFTNENGELRPLKDVVASASADRESIMVYIAKKLSQTGLALRPESIPLLLRAYEHSYPFTQNVVFALLHQRQFIKNLYSFGWSRSGSGIPLPTDLETAYLQYAEFLQAVTTPHPIEPGWKDDLIWHTHQLMPAKYRVNIVSYIQVFLNHLPRGEHVNGHPPTGGDALCGKAVAGCQDCQDNPPPASNVFLKSEPEGDAGR